MKKKLKLIACIIILALIASAGIVIKVNSMGKIDGVKLSKTHATIKVGKTVKIRVTGENADSVQNVKWSSGDKKIAKVNHNGKVTGIAEGKVTIKAKIDGKVYKCKITVKPANNSEKDDSEGDASSGDDDEDSDN